MSYCVNFSRVVIGASLFALAAYGTYRLVRYQTSDPLDQLRKLSVAQVSPLQMTSSDQRKLIALHKDAQKANFEVQLLQIEATKLNAEQVREQIENLRKGNMVDRNWNDLFKSYLRRAGLPGTKDVEEEVQEEGWVTSRTPERTARVSYGKEQARASFDSMQVGYGDNWNPSGTSSNAEAPPRRPPPRPGMGDGDSNPRPPLPRPGSSGSNVCPPGTRPTHSSATSRTSRSGMSGPRMSGPSGGGSRGGPGGRR